MTRHSLNTDITNNRYMLFLWAGASAPLGLKPTEPFLKRILEILLTIFRQAGSDYEKQNNIAKFIDPLFKQAAKHCGVTLPDSGIILDYLNFIVETFHELSELPGEYARLAGTAAVGDLHNRQREMWMRLRNHIQKMVVEHYSIVEGETALQIYKPLL